MRFTQSGMVRPGVLVGFAIQLELSAASRCTQAPQDPSLARSQSFKIFSSTYNAGNVKWDVVENATGIMQQILADVSDADLAIMGFQEFKRLCRDGTDTFSHISNLLWPQRSAHQKIGGAYQLHGSGPFCYSPRFGGRHYDTAMYVYSNPNSAWQAVFPSRTNRRGKQKARFNMNVSRLGECGKAVNFIKFHMILKSDPDTNVSVCAMNTHMSFRSTASDRLKYIAEAASEARKRSCDVTVFVGDFNSRLHCEPKPTCTSSCRTGQPNETSEADCECCPLFDKCTSTTKEEQGGQKQDALQQEAPTTLQKMFRTFCPQSGSCKLSAGPELFDELSQFLRADGEPIACYEGEKGVYKLKVRETVPMGLVEVGRVDFPMTYKFLARGNSLTADSEQFRIANQTVFSDGKGRHNFAWTDRILVNGPMTGDIRLTTESYRSILLDDAQSDHMPVTAVMVVEISTRSGV